MDLAANHSITFGYTAKTLCLLAGFGDILQRRIKHVVRLAAVL
jgi:predicted histidine transporter YuiF (NhaC family)